MIKNIKEFLNYYKKCPSCKSSDKYIEVFSTHRDYGVAIYEKTEMHNNRLYIIINFRNFNYDDECSMSIDIEDNGVQYGEGSFGILSSVNYTIISHCSNCEGFWYSADVFIYDGHTQISNIMEETLRLSDEDALYYFSSHNNIKESYFAISNNDNNYDYDELSYILQPCIYIPFKKLPLKSKDKLITKIQAMALLK